MRIIKRYVKQVVLLTAFSSFALGTSLQAVHAAPGGSVEPDVPVGITILPLDKHPVPDVMKTQARLELKEMSERGYVDSTEEAVSYLDKAKQNKDNRLKPMKEVAPKLKIVPANIASSALGNANFLGAAASGGHTEEGWTGLDRVFVVPKLGIVGLNEIDYIESQGGMAFIEEAINQEVNGFPAILRVKQSRSKKGLTELTWATDRKIYTLSTNRALKNQKSIDEFLAFANSIL